MLYCNPGYAMRINELPDDESAAMLDFLFAHQLRPEYRHMHNWTERDLLVLHVGLCDADAGFACRDGEARLRRVDFNERLTFLNGLSFGHVDGLDATGHFRRQVVDRHRANLARRRDLRDQLRAAFNLADLDGFAFTFLKDFR